MTWVRSVTRWVCDYRNIGILLASVLVAYLGVLVATSIADRQRALDAAISATTSEREARQAAIHRIDQLLIQIKVLQRDAEANAAQIAALREEVALLQRQVRDLGGQPVVVGAGGDAPPSSHPSPSPSAPPPSPSSSPSRTPTASASPSRTCVPLVCLRGHG